MTIISYILTGIAVGVASGFFGIGGGVIMIPILVFFFGLSQHTAQGTSLAALLLPVSIFAVLKYHDQNEVKISMAIFIAVGVLLGAYFGAVAVHHVSDPSLKKIFGLLLLATSIKILIGK